MTYGNDSIAVLAMDFEGATLGFLSDPAPLVARAAEAVARVRAAGGLVTYVRVGFTDDDYAAFPAHSIMGNRVKSNRPSLDADAATAALHPGLDVQAEDVVVRKIRVGAFSKTDLHRRLQDASVSTLVLAGVHTSGAVLTTVREAHDLDYRVVVVADACADPQAEVHDFLVSSIFPKQAEVALTENLGPIIRQSGP